MPLKKKILLQVKAAFNGVKYLRKYEARNEMKCNSHKNSIPGLNLNHRAQSQDNSTMSDKSLKMCMNKLLVTRLLQEYSYNSRKSSTNTDRRSEKHQHPSTLPSSIYSESENSVTDRVMFPKSSNRKSEIELKDVESFFEIESFKESKVKKKTKNDE